MIFLVSLLLMLLDREFLVGQQETNDCCSSAVNPLDSYDANKLALANNDLALKLHKTFGSSGNVFISPVSIFTALGMLYTGARGLTAKEIRRALSYDVAGLSDETINHHFQKLLLSFVDGSDQYKLEMANAVISQNTYPVSKAYKKTLKNFYGAVVKEVNFMKDSEELLQEINNWVSSKTHRRITKLLDSLDPDTVLLLLNAVYFKGKWQQPFHPEVTSKRDFYNKGVNVVAVDTMVLQGHFFYGDFPDYEMKALKMSYVGNRISMIVLLPLQRDGLQAAEEELTATMLKNIITRLKDRFVIIRFPKFKFEDSRELKQNLSSLGMKSAFTDLANFGGINKEANLKITKIIHKAMIEVNEVGTVATGATVLSAEPKMLEREFYFAADHPFLIFIVDDSNGMILFSGRVDEL